MKYAFDKGIFSIAAKEVITQYLPEPLSGAADDDDGGDDDSGDENE